MRMTNFYNVTYNLLVKNPRGAGTSNTNAIAATIMAGSVTEAQRKLEDFCKKTVDGFVSTDITNLTKWQQNIIL
jgi:hypothetical protein